MNVDAIVACFAASFSPDGNTRIAAELELRKLEKLNGMPATVLQIIATPSSDLSVRLAAAVYLKNRLARSWTEPSSPGETVSSTHVAIGEGDRSTIKQNILAVMVDATQQNVKVQLKTCLSTIVINDFPESWPNLVSTIQQYIQSDQTAQIEGGLLALVEIVKVYRYRRHDREVPNALCSQFMPLLVALGQSLLASHPPPAAPEYVARLLHLIVKVYKISMIADLSPHQASQQSIVQWGTFLLQIVCRVIPESEQAKDKDDREKQEWWKAKKWAHHVLNRLYGTYGSPSQLTSSASKHKPFAANFEHHFAPEILKAYLRCIEGYVNGSVWMSKRCRRFILEFLEDCVKPKSMWQLLKPHLDTVVSQFVFPCMCLTEEEIEQFENDPVEYSRAHFGDFIEDWFASPITAAITFLQVLVRSRKQTTMMPMLDIINSIVSGYPDKRSAVEKDGALRMLSCLAPVIVKSKEVGDKMQDFFVAFIFPEFTSEVGHLRVRALDMVEKFEEVDMAWPDSARLTEMFNKVMICMTDPSLPVRVQAALALPELVRYEEVREGLAPNVGRLMQELLKLSEDTDIDALSKPTRALVTTFPDELLPFATGISTQMRDSYMRVIHEVIEMRARTDSHDLFAGGTDNLAAMSDEADEKILVAMNTLQTLETLLRSVSTAPPIVAEIETILLPILFTSLQHEFVELYDDLFELVHSLTYFQRAISPDMWKFFDAMYALIKGSGIDFIEEMSNVLDNYVSYGGDYLCHQSTYRGMLADIFQIAMTSDQLGASDRVSVCKMAGQTLLSLTGYMDEYLETYVAIAMSFVVRENSQEEPVVTNELHVNALELVVTALYYNPRLTLSTLQKHNHSQTFFSQWFSKLAHFTRVHDRKICILAITRTLTSVSQELLSLPGIAEQLLKAAIHLFDGLPKAIEQRRQLENDFGKQDESDDEVASEDEDNSNDAGDDQDVQDEDNAYAEILAHKQRELDALNAATKVNGNSGHASRAISDSRGDGDEDEEEESEYDDEEGLFGAEQLFETSLDKLDSYQLFVEALHNLQSTQQALFTQTTGSLDQAQQKALNDIAQVAHSGGENLKSAKQ